MWKRLTMAWTLWRGDARRLWRALRHPAAPAWLKLGVLGLVVYVLSPIDLVPDWVPVVGLLDDLAVITLGMRFLLEHLPPAVKADLDRAAGSSRPGR